MPKVVLLIALTDIEQTLARGALPTEGGNATGLCKAVLDRHGSPRLLTTMMMDWPKYSGNPAYPIPSCRGKSAREEYQQATERGMWFGTKYAELRRELLAYLIKELQNAI
ncbi:hypothetical protein ETP1_005 [Edwardsiella phage ETP-1]|uniref:Uncharacterized protein n=3 Tax=Kafunavirus KF1 TaxID=1982588 RepID=A0A6G5P4A2_9CAUD|nr:hypothetical protein D877_gp08 [Edwardsiella phage KF-1]QBP07006.1 hypothetical protein ETP1_005 [Edwardsiella phage ETP-1]UIS54065.1 hypothetical protein ZHX_gp5 [Edwardsiella phage vB_EpP_ZHX]BAM63056.1 hypothetical protein [Edwardsiella phage KF-1]BAM63104.1 hypothetical protein [Edwardsiella phage IW-1]